MKTYAAGVVCLLAACLAAACGDDDDDGGVSGGGGETSEGSGGTSEGNGGTSEGGGGTSGGGGSTSEVKLADVMPLVANAGVKFPVTAIYWGNYPNPFSEFSYKDGRMTLCNYYFGSGYDDDGLTFSENPLTGTYSVNATDPPPSTVNSRTST